MQKFGQGRISIICPMVMRRFFDISQYKSTILENQQAGVSNQMTIFRFTTINDNSDIFTHFYHDIIRK